MTALWIVLTVVGVVAAAFVCWCLTQIDRDGD